MKVVFFRNFKNYLNLFFLLLLSSVSTFIHSETSLDITGDITDISYDNPKQIAQLLLTTLKTGALLFTDSVDSSNLTRKKFAAFIKLLAHTADGTTKMLDERKVRSDLLKGFSTVTSACQGLKDIEEYATLSKMHLYDRKKLQRYLKRYYEPSPPRLGSSAIGSNAIKSMVLRKVVKPSLRILEWVASVGLITNAKNKGKWLLAQGVCDFLARYVCSEGEFSSNSVISQLESVTSLFPLLSAVGSGVHEFNENLKKEPRLGDRCRVCGRVYGENGLRACQMRTCKHWCCVNCAEACRREDVFGMGMAQWDDYDGTYSESSRIICPICRQPNRTYVPVNVRKPEAEVPGFAYRENPSTVGKPLVVEDDSQEKVCSICAEEKKLISLPCHHEHKFCVDCIEKWWYQGKDTCPICRKRFNRLSFGNYKVA